MKDRVDIVLVIQSRDDSEDGRASWLSRRRDAVLAPGQTVPQQARSEAKDDGQAQDHGQQELDVRRRWFSRHSGLGVDTRYHHTVPAQLVKEYRRGARCDLLRLYWTPALGHDVDNSSAGQCLPMHLLRQLGFRDGKRQGGRHFVQQRRAGDELDISRDEAADQIRVVGQDAGVSRDRKKSHRGRRLVGLRAGQCIPRASEEHDGGNGQADQLPAPQNPGHSLWCDRIGRSAGTQLAFFFSAGVVWHRDSVSGKPAAGLTPKLRHRFSIPRRER